MIHQAYIAGSYTADTRTRNLQNISRALVAACALTKKGFHPIVPHTSGCHRVGWDEAMDRCRAIIRGLDPTRDCLVLLPGWEESRGAREEHVLATGLGLPVLSLSDVMQRTVVEVLG